MNRKKFDDLELANEKITEQRKELFVLKHKLIQIRKVLNTEYNYDEIVKKYYDSKQINSFWGDEK